MDEPPPSAHSLAPPSAAKVHRGSIGDIFSRVISRSSSVANITTCPDELVRTGQLTQLKSLINHDDLDTKTWREFKTKRNLLHLAALSNQVEIINFMLGESRLDINLQDRYGNTALHLAVINGNLDATAAILSHKPNDSLCNEDHDPPLHVAIRQGAKGIKLVSEFVRHPFVDLFVRGYHDYTSLHVIARTNNLKALEVLHNETTILASMASFVFVKNRSGNSTLHVASRTGSHSILNYFFSLFARSNIPVQTLHTDLSDDSRMPLHYAVERGHVECVRVLLEYGADPTVVSGCHPPPIHLACSHGKVDIVKLMVEKHGMGVLQSRDHYGGTALHSSTVSIRSKDLISYLVQNGVDPNDVDHNGFSPLLNAIQLGSVHAVDELLQQGGDPLIKDKWGYTALHRAVFSERIEVFRKVVCSDKADVMARTQDSHGYYPIHYALKLALYDMVVALLDIVTEEFHDHYGNNYLHLASSAGDEHSVSHLLGIPSFQHMINEANVSGCTPLHCAALSSKASIVRKLLNHGAVTHKNNDGHTPFMLACSKGNLDVVKLLYCRSKFQRDWVDNSERTALHLAAGSFNPDVITYCLDTRMGIALDEDQFSFFDRVLSYNCRKMAKAVVSHKRWEECISIFCPDRPHPILRILDQMPDIFQIILDNCHVKCDLDPAHPDYWEEFNFRCLYLQREDEDHSMPKEGHHVVLSSINEFNPHLKVTEDDPVHAQLHTEGAFSLKEVSSVHNFRTQVHQRQMVRKRWRRQLKMTAQDSLTVVRKLIKNRLESSLLHPVVENYIKLKWNGFGVYYQLAIMVAFFFLAFFFSLFITSVPLPQQSPNTTLNQTMESDSLGVRQQVLLYTSLILAVLNFVVFLLDLYVYGSRLIWDFFEEFQVWSNFLATANIVIYLVSVLVRGVEKSLWNAAAMGSFFAWLSFGFSLQFVSIFNIGIYITLLMSSTKLIFKVLIILLVFLLALSFPLYLLSGTVVELQYTTIPLSLFNNLHTLVGVTDYLGFVRLEQLGDEQLRFSVFLFLFLSVQIVFLTISIVNLLIGLAVGDIAKIQKEAIITRQAVEVRALTSLDRHLLPYCLIKQLSKHSYRNYPNRKKTWTELAIGLFHRTFDSRSAGREDLSKRNLQEVVKQDLLEEKKKHEQRLDRMQEILEQLAADRLEHLDGGKGLRSVVKKVMRGQKMARNDTTQNYT